MSCNFVERAFGSPTLAAIRSAGLRVCTPLRRAAVSKRSSKLLPSVVDAAVSAARCPRRRSWGQIDAGSSVLHCAKTWRGEAVEEDDDACPVRNNHLSGGGGGGEGYGIVVWVVEAVVVVLAIVMSGWARLVWRGVVCVGVCWSGLVMVWGGLR